jgi:hypothetical protein
MGNAKAATFDLGSLDTIEACNKPAEIEIKHPVTLVGTGVFWSFVGKDSDIYRGRVRGMADESLRRQATGKGAADQTLDKLEAKNIEAIVAATTGFRTGDDPAVVLNGERLEYSPANARRILTDILPIREQVAEGINDLGNFMPA